MKQIISTTIFLSLILLTCQADAQVAIGKSSLTNSSVLLEFGAGNKGIILPSVPDATGAVGGTFIYNTTSNSVQVWEQPTGGSGVWSNLSELGAGIPNPYINIGTDNPSVAGVIIGAPNTAKPGVLVLESTTKAMVLPVVENPHVTMPGSVAGTIVYDSVSDTMAVYDGASWNYWK